MIVVAACFFLETAWIPSRPGVRLVRIRPGAPPGFEPAIGRPDLLVSAGFSGGLRAGLETGDLVLASEIVHGGRRIAISPELFARAARALGKAGIVPQTGPILTASRVVGTAREKGRLRGESGAACVDMEAGRLAEWADEEGVPFIALKAVLDRADRALPLRRTADALRRPVAAIRFGIAGIRAGRAIGRGMEAIAAGFGGGG